MVSQAVTRIEGRPAGSADEVMEPTSEMQDQGTEEGSVAEARVEGAEQNLGSTPEGDGTEVSMDTDVGRGLVLAECDITALVKKGSDEA
eukprot:4745063-Amphidinium_carterae.7